MDFSRSARASDLVERLDEFLTERVIPAEATAAAQEQELLRKAVARLPSNQRDIIEKAYFGDLSHSEIADFTGLPLGTIKSRIRLGLERLRHELK